MNTYDIIVVGAGHAGCEAAYISARLKKKTLLLTISLDVIAQMSCNPAIGGLAKTHLVREVDILGGLMGRVIDQTGIQFKVLNMKKGSAVRALRAQADKKNYQLTMKHLLENMADLDIKQEMVDDIIVQNNIVCGVKTHRGNIYHGRCVILTVGTFMKGLIHVGRFQESAGRFSEPSAEKISESLKKIGIAIGRLKTGTPPRVNGSTIDFEKCERQAGDTKVFGFSYNSRRYMKNTVDCWITYTNTATHQLIRDNLKDAPLYSGQINSIGPRYCPSIEDKVIKFPERDRHQLFLEPEGEKTNEYYVNGFPTSIPEAIQLQALRTVCGLENVEIMRPGYAIEYDFIKPNQMQHSLESKIVKGLYFAGQINGTSGYEEAAAQGIMAGINAARQCDQIKPFILKRSESYIGVMIDDLVNKTLEEPYRMFTSRAEYRILLREDNVDRRLIRYAKRIGSLSDDYRKNYLRVIKEFRYIKYRLITTKVSKDESTLLTTLGLKNIKTGVSYAELLKRPEVDMNMLKIILPFLKHYNQKTLEKVAYQIIYRGYEERHRLDIKKRSDQEGRLIPNDFNYDTVAALGCEAKQKLNRVRPKTIGQASRISGVDPTDISVLLILLDRYEKRS